MLVNTYSEQAEVTKAHMGQLWALFSQIGQNIANKGNTDITAKLADIGNSLTETWAFEYEQIQQEAEHAENDTIDRSKEKI